MLKGDTRQLWYGLNSSVVILPIRFDPNAAVAYRTSCCYRGSPSHKGIKDNPFSQGKGGTNDLPHESLRF